MSLADAPLPLSVALFAAGALMVWFAGARLAGYADTISQRTGIGQAMIGVLLLGAVTSLPEITTTSVAVASGNPPMAVNNLIGGVAFQVVVIALADLFVGKDALTSMVPGPRVMLNAAVSIVLLVLVALGVMVGDREVAGAGFGFFPLLIVGTYLLCIWQLGRNAAARGWTPGSQSQDDLPEVDKPDISTRKLALFTLLAAGVICLGGTIVTLAAEGIAEQTGTDTAIMGLTLLAFATSLPELSTAIAAVRLRRAELAIGDILGGNMFDVTLILLIDVMAAGPLVLHQVERSAMGSALLGILLTVLVLIGLLERRDKARFRMGYDSIAVLIVYCSGMGAILGGAFAD
ncbi:hypothetical protein CP97_14911 (plasmid) [Aurantiacibacter atlanticus]|uniref:Sodium/calcium exchanger membrane region domain-containing protein n=1 Tax=Aurantiacibacter atlanticus TaxID=1648404 RepID=A0A161IUK6_9SPHN|nr:sodium:calcium antiporter [Aurantiacibacter atlanticus]ANC50600.1 hypothetical protein CP97_14911 [Aurantiacibacter atlanticus]